MSHLADAALAARLHGSRERLIELTQALVRVPSPTPPGDTTAVARLATALLGRVDGAEVREVTAVPPFANVVARLRGCAEGRRLVFNGHLDTFPLGDDSAWSVPPLGGVLRRAKLFGRGVSDMKGGIACSLLAFEILAEMRDRWSGELVVTLAADEESMGPHGTKYLLDTLPYAAGDAMISADVGSPDVLRFGEKGLFWLEITAVGHPAHGAHVHRGVNAIDRLRRALDALEGAVRALPVRMPEPVAGAIAEAREISERSSGAGEAEVLGKATVNIGTIEGGVSTNLVPALARATADIRLPLGLTTSEIERQLTAVLAAHDGVSWRVLRRFEPNHTDPDHEIVGCVADAAEAVLGRRPAVNMRIGASDARWYRMHGVPTVIYGPTPFNMGGADEYVLVDELHAVAKVHCLAALSFLAGDHTRERTCRE